MKFLADNNGRPWNATAGRRLLSNRVYLGEARYGDGLVNRAAHEPLIDLATFTEANKQIAGRAEYSPSREYPLAKVACCASCGEGLTGNILTKSNARSYRCKRNYRKSDSPPCEAPAMIRADDLEDFTRAALVAYIATSPLREEQSVLLEGGDEADIERAEAALRSAEMERSKDASDVRLRDLLGEEAFYERLEAHNAAVAEAQQEYEKAVAEARPELSWPLVDEVASATADRLPVLLERCDLTVKVTRGPGDLPDRVRLAPRTPE